MRLEDHVTLNFNNNLLTTAVFLDIEKAFHTTWHSGILYTFLKFEFSTSFVNIVTCMGVHATKMTGSSSDD
jgi:hypothetical protein